MGKFRFGLPASIAASMIALSGCTTTQPQQEAMSPVSTACPGNPRPVFKHPKLSVDGAMQPITSLRMVPARRPMHAVSASSRS